jgi:hypothetical protein
MENQRLYQNTLTFIFKKLTSEEREIALHIVLDKNHFETSGEVISR